MNPVSPAPVLIVLIAMTAAGSGAIPTAAPAQSWPEPAWHQASAAACQMDQKELEAARDYALSGGGSGLILQHGKQLLTWGDLHRRYDLKSSTKSIGLTAMALAIADGKLEWTDHAVTRHPRFAIPPDENALTSWRNQITLLHLASQTAGFAKPGGYQPLLFAPGMQWSYSDGGPNWLAECITLAYRRDINDLLFERVFQPIGIRAEDLRWRQHAYRPRQLDGIVSREFGSGIEASVDAMARIGYLYLRQGQWKDRQIIPRAFVEQVRTTMPSVARLPVADPAHYGQASRHYGLLWWNNADGAMSKVPRDAYWSWGLYDSLIVVIPSLDVVVARAGGGWKRDPGADHYNVLLPFLGPIVQSVRQEHSSTEVAPPCPPSPVISKISWDPPEKIMRLARGSDNWPATWGDDDAIYTRRPLQRSPGANRVPPRP